MQITKEMAKQIEEITNRLSTERTLLHNALVSVNYHFNNVDKITNEIMGLSSWISSVAVDEEPLASETKNPAGVNIGNALSTLLSGEPLSEEESQKMGLPKGSLKMDPSALEALKNLLGSRASFAAPTENVVDHQKDDQEENKG